MTGAPDGRFPLAGVRVIDFGDAWAGPYACTLLADAGAEVIRIEDIHRMPANMRGPRTPVSPFEGYLGLDPGDRPWERFFLYNGCERNKFGITLDLKQEPGRELFDRLIVDADILITNYRRRTLASFGIEYERLSALNPRLLMLFISGYGLDGPYADHVALGTTIDAITGHQALNGYPDTTPGETAQTYYPDAATAYHCYFVAQSMLFERERTGRGMFLEVALSEVVYHHLGAHLAAAAASGGTLAVHGNRDPRFAPQGCYPTRSLDPDPDLPNRQTGDRWIAIACETDDQWRRLAQLIGEASLLTDARFDDAASRFTYHDAIDAVISAWTADQDATELMHRLQRSGVPAVAVMPDSDLFADPHIAMRGYLQQHVKRDGAFRGPGPIWRSRRHVRPRVRRPANGLGEHNRQLFQGRLGLTDAEFELLEQCGVCGDRYQLEPVASEVVSGRQGTP